VLLNVQQQQGDFTGIFKLDHEESPLGRGAAPYGTKNSGRLDSAPSLLPIGRRHPDLTLAARSPLTGSSSVI
jgi:hypothetical protein